MQTAPEVMEGTWEEISRHIAKLNGHRLRVTILPDEMPAITDHTKDPTLALFEQWAKEDAAMTPEEREAEDRLWEQFEQNIYETRTASGMRTL